MQPVERRADTAHDGACGRAVTLLDVGTMSELDVDAGDVVYIEGEGRTVATVEPQPEGGSGSDAVGMDSFLRGSAGVKPGQRVRLEPAEAQDAEVVRLQPTAPRCAPVSDGDQPAVASQLVDRPLLAGDDRWVMTQPNAEFGVLTGNWRPLRVRDTEPEGAVVLRRSTDIRIDSPFEEAAGDSATQKGVAGSDYASRAALEAAVRERDDGVCRNCGVAGGGGRATLETHYVVTPAHGGTVAPSNVVTLCADCHAVAHRPMTTPST